MKTKGFTLIELIVVIVILGILATTAAPKFINLKADAHTATLQGLAAAIEGAAAQIYGKSVVKGNHTKRRTFFDLPSVETEYGDIGITYGYPIADDSEWEKILNLSDDYRIRGTTDGSTIIFYLAENPVPTAIGEPCTVVYEQAQAGLRSQVTVYDCE